MIFLLQDESYEEVYTVSGNSSQDQSDSEPEIADEVLTSHPGQSQTAVKSSVPAAKTSLSSRGVSRDGSSVSVSQSVSSTIGSNKIGPSTTTNIPAQLTSVNAGQNIQGQRSKTPGLNDFAKETLATRYKINKTPDRDLKVRQRLSKTPDREIGASRRHSFAASKRLSKSCDSLDSSGNVSGDKDANQGPEVGLSKKKGKLKDHRQKGKRAATVHTLDTDQLLLILNLQMRYLQETRDQQSKNSNTVNPGTRRAVTPQPVSQRTVIPQKVRSHTPQPQRANQRTRDQVNAFPQNYGWNIKSQGAINNTNSANSSRRTSESSERNFDITAGVLYGKGNSVGSESYLLGQQIQKTVPHIHEGYSPYIHTQFQNNSADNVHFVTYSDSMLNNPPNKPKSRASVQNYFLPPQPIRRGTQGQLPAQPVSRQRSSECQLPSQPVHRGSSAFHVVDRNSKSRSPSLSNEKIPEKINSTPKRKVRRDYADVAIRENFSLNPKPFILKEAQDVTNSSRNEQVNPSQQKGHFMMRNEKYFPAENLPPYSGPPSYKEHVSSCNTSVTSSLSSNPDDFYSMPKRRIVSDQETAVNSSGCKNGPYIVNANIYENSEMSYGNNLQHCVPGQEQEIIYSSPAKSKVKQCIVPEDYYTQIGHVSRDGRYANQRDVDNRDILNTQRPSVENVYGNSTSFQGSGLQNTHNASIYGQIAPDAKYQDYEDVYDMPESVRGTLPQKSGSNTDNSMYCVNTQGINCAKTTPKTKPKIRNPKKNSKSPYQVSNVNVNTKCLDFVHSENIKQNRQILDSVENVHAENMSKIPQIKLNDHEVGTADISDDDVFLSEDPEVGYRKKQKSNGGNRIFSETGKEMRENFVVTQNQNYQEISDFDVPGVNQELGHVVSDFTSEETETGYMKMSLPGKNNSLPNFSQVVNQAAPILSNQTEPSDHVTEVMNQNSRRQMPDGIENVSSEENEGFEETGV